ncbi:serine palmitoyltransferase [Aquibaculum arenosum]|uniref:Aminotransferase class I/II-fold pyridoxal phosphate-dependent enzyme n=1 Tax=Aquibaculum arenosum TaxID=3032591 RepID=A0ABT5YI74_9PROT|nr:aminotransferase class I/II-fold pyridoxal phosphate-dependent enzyme [Fodinicurvata sp. CAU 1616]MDF2094641.1 aminotransferase class I/II-fold pyridoxal phosphate-dependent enzyme [Fodinicurvata sp. CAU 1616]
MDILAKYDGLAERRDLMLEAGANPFGLRMEKVLSPTEALVNGRRTLLVGTNNYLGLTFDPHCIAAGVKALQEQGTGTTGSRIANGSYALHEALEEAIARFLKRKSAIVWPTGYQANLGMIAGLAGPGDTILLDADSHSSIYDGCRLSGATLVRFRHNDPADLDKRLARLRRQGAAENGALLVIVEGIYSMLGDIAPLPEFVEVKDRHGAFLLVDEAHSLGVMGVCGRGVAEAQGIEAGVDFLAGTFSKSLGAIGGFGVSDHPHFERLRYCSRPYMFTASASPASIATVIAAIERIEQEPGLIKQLWRNAEALHSGLAAEGFEIAAPVSPVVAVKLPDERLAVAFWNALLQAGIYVNLAVPPGTPNNSCLMRCSVSAAHTPEQIQGVVRTFVEVREALDASAPAS